MRSALVYSSAAVRAVALASLAFYSSAAMRAAGAGLCGVRPRAENGLLERADVIVLLTGSHHNPTGFAFLTLRPTPYYDGPLAQLEELYVRPELRDKGQGTALLQTAIRLVREHGGGEIHINVDEVDADTRRFYERHGFVNIEPGADYRMLCYIREL